jgi:hypothetical protein
MSWSPPMKLIAFGWLLALGAALFALVSTDPPGRVLLAIGAVVVAFIATYGTVARPRLKADSAGLTVRGLVKRRHFSWDTVEVRVARTRRLGRDVATLELDATDDLVVLGWLDLGADPDDVLDVLRTLRS